MGFFPDAAGHRALARGPPEPQRDIYHCESSAAPPPPRRRGRVQTGTYGRLISTDPNIDSSSRPERRRRVVEGPRAGERRASKRAVASRNKLPPLRAALPRFGRDDELEWRPSTSRRLGFPSATSLSSSFRPFDDRRLRRWLARGSAEGA
jgi:hypothetical protein